MNADVFDYPFFNEGVSSLKQYTSDKEIYQLDDIFYNPKDTLLKIKGFIFHTSHCGSTLLARMLSCSPEVRVVSESEAINGLLLASVLYRIPRTIILDQLASIIKSYQQPLGEECFVIFKLSSWNIFFADLFQELYPKVKWLYIDRGRQEVVKSLLISGRGMTDWYHHPVDIIRKYFLGENTVYPDQETYLTDLIKRHRTQAQKAKNDCALFINYPDFIAEFETLLLPYFNLIFDTKTLQKLKKILTFHAKTGEVWCG